MKVVHYGESISHFENETVFKQFQAMRQPTIQTYYKQNGLDFTFNDAATKASPKETSTQQKRMDYTLFIGLAVVAVICVIAYHYWHEEKKKKMQEM